MINYDGKRCNDNISDIVTEKGIAKIERKVEKRFQKVLDALLIDCLLYTSPSPRDVEESRMPSSA